MGSGGALGPVVRPMFMRYWSGALPLVFLLSQGLVACGKEEPAKFPLKAPFTRDTDLELVNVPCRSVEDDEGSRFVCMPKEYISSLVWDGADNMVFRPLSDFFAVKPKREAINVNSRDEVPDSAWFTNRLGSRSLSPAELALGACSPEQILHPAEFADGSWLIDQGKPNGASPGFRVRIPGKGKFLLKSDGASFERPSAASVIGAAVYHAAGYFTSCEQVVYIKPSLLRLKPGLKSKANFEEEKPFDERALAALLAQTPKRDGLLRFQASAWLPGRPIGPFRYEGKREDDPNDVIPHQHRRELRGGRVLAAWLNHFDAREQNSMSVWMAANPEEPESSPGKAIHYYLDTSDCLGSKWALDGLSRRLGHSYVFDAGDIALDFITFGTMKRPWERAEIRPRQELFNYFDVENFDPERWKMEYSNPAFNEMTERDAAWMARILSEFTPESVDQLAVMGNFSLPENTQYIASVLKGRLQRILDRYLTRVSPLSKVEVSGNQICAEDRARVSRVRGNYLYSSRVVWGWGARVTNGGAELAAQSTADGRVCVTLPAPSASRDAPEYIVVRIENGVARGPLLVHVYDLGPSGYRLAGLERPDA